MKQGRYNDGTSKIHNFGQSDTMKITPDRRASGAGGGEKKKLSNELSSEIVNQYFDEAIEVADQLVKDTEDQLNSLKVEEPKKPKDHKDDPPTVVLYFDDPNQSAETHLKDVRCPPSPSPPSPSSFSQSLFTFSGTVGNLPGKLGRPTRELDLL